MASELSKGFLILLVGMFTVFVILALVVLSGKLLIYIINRFVPVPSEPVKKERSSSLNPVLNNNIQPNQLAVIVAAVDAVTNGQGTITKIEKIS